MQIAMQLSRNFRIGNIMKHHNLSVPLCKTEKKLIVSIAMMIMIMIITVKNHDHHCDDDHCAHYDNDE